MNAYRRERGQTLILLATWLFFAGGAASALVFYGHSVSAMKKGVERVITDGRRDVILSEIDQWESVQETRDEIVSENREALLKSFRRKSAPRSDLEPTLARLDRTFLVMDRDFLDLRFRVKAQVTRAEWAGIVAAHER
jgi:hypothetical protein